MLLKHSLYEDYLTLALFYLKLLLSLHLLLSFVLWICSLLKKVLSWSRVVHFKIVHFDFERSLTVDLQDFCNKILLAFVVATDILILKESYSCQKIFNKHSRRELGGSLKYRN